MTTKISGDNISAIANQGVTWNAVTVADGSTQLNASAGNGYFLDTNAGVIEVKLPSSPTRGDTIVLADYGNNFATNRVVVDTGGKLIDSVVGGEPDSDFAIETNGAVVELVFADDTAGWIIKQNNAPSDLGAEDYAEYISATGGTVATSGDFKIHTFTGDGCFVVSCAGNPAGSDSVDYLVVAGGGGGGQAAAGDNGGGGGAGGYRESSGTTSGCYSVSPLGACVAALSVSATTYPITVGGGGTAGTGSPSSTAIGGQGSNSVFSTITSTGGGGGGGVAPSGGSPWTNPNGRIGGPGGSGGGAGGGASNDNPGGSGNTPPVAPPQGQAGGDSAPPGPSDQAGGGGGGATEGSPATNAPGSTTNDGGRGGAGATTSISGTPLSYSGGGGTGCGAGSPCETGGAGGNGSTGDAGTTNRGGGGGGSNNTPTAGAGGKGIVIIRYKFQN